MSKEHRQPPTADRLNQIKPYLFDTLNKLKAGVEAKTGRKVLDFGAGSPDFPPSKIYLQKLTEY
ncbi:MAG: hypothetical protein Q8Q24_00035, partial [bacterium]|nr:hypothetical protein [bacterium]